MIEQQPCQDERFENSMEKLGVRSIRGTFRSCVSLSPFHNKVTLTVSEIRQASKPRRARVLANGLLEEKNRLLLGLTRFLR